MADRTSGIEKGMDDARALLNSIPALQRRCDLDLLVFFVRHWRTLLSSEQLAWLLGYPLQEIVRSRDVLVAAGLLTRAQHSTRPEWMYVLDPECMNGGPLPAIVTLASTPSGRLSLRRALTCVQAGGTDDVPAPGRQSPDPAQRTATSGWRQPKRSQSTERRSSEQRAR